MAQGCTHTLAIRSVDGPRAMIILVNPRATRPPNRRFPLSVMAIGAAIPEGESWEIVDGNRPDIDVAARIADIVLSREGTADAVRAILDGHIILSRDLGAAGHYPAIDILNSVSRLTSDIATTELKVAMNKLREAMATYRRTEDLINLGAYVSGANPKVDAAVRVRQGMEDFLKQPPNAKIGLQETLLRMADLAMQV